MLSAGPCMAASDVFNNLTYSCDENAATDN